MPSTATTTKWWATPPCPSTFALASAFASEANRTAKKKRGARFTRAPVIAKTILPSAHLLRLSHQCNRHRRGHLPAKIFCPRQQQFLAFNSAQGLLLAQ